MEVIKYHGGNIKLVYYNRVGLRYLFKPHKFQNPIYFSEPPKKINDKLRNPMEQPEQIIKDMEELKMT